MSRSLLILVVTVIVVAAFYYGFNRFASPSAPDAGRPASALPQVSDTTPGSGSGPAKAPGAQAGVDQHATASAPASAAAPAPGMFTIAISKAHPPAPSDVIRVKKDDQVTLTITTDRPGHLEVHGYRKEVSVEPGTPATLSFAAVRTGRFPIDLHASGGEHVEVTALEVMPR